MARIVGARLHGDRLRRLGGHVARSGIIDAVEEGVELIAEEARSSIIAGAVSGPEHTPSAPGEPPNADTHELDQSIKTTMDRTKIVGRAIAEAEYAAAQEYGTSTLPERPFMRPAGKKKRPAARRLVVAAVNKANRGF